MKQAGGLENDQANCEIINCECEILENSGKRATPRLPEFSLAITGMGNYRNPGRDYVRYTHPLRSITLEERVPVVAEAEHPGGGDLPRGHIWAMRHLPRP